MCVKQCEYGSSIFFSVLFAVPIAVSLSECTPVKWALRDSRQAGGWCSERCSTTKQKQVALGGAAKSVATGEGFKARLQFVKLSYQVTRSQARASRGQVYSCDKKRNSTSCVLFFTLHSPQHRLKAAQMSRR